MKYIMFVLIGIWVIIFILISGCIEIESDKTNKTNKGVNETLCDNYTGVCKFQLDCDNYSGVCPLNITEAA